MATTRNPSESTHVLTGSATQETVIDSQNSREPASSLLKRKRLLSTFSEISAIYIKTSTSKKQQV